VTAQLAWRSATAGAVPVASVLAWQASPALSAPPRARSAPRLAWLVAVAASDAQARAEDEAAPAERDGSRRRAASALG